MENITVDQRHDLTPRLLADGYWDGKPDDAFYCMNRMAADVS